MKTTPTKDFILLPDGTATHSLTGLTWKRYAEGQVWNGICEVEPDAYEWEQAIALERYGWRLPTIAELNTIVEFNAFRPSINLEVFPYTPARCFWTATPYAGTSGYAWYVNFDYGFDNYFSYQTNGYYVRLVRGGQSLGEYTPDFTDNGDGTVTHRKTGLTWQRCVAGQIWDNNWGTCTGTVGTYTWDQANALGSDGWRLPTMAELRSIVEYKNVGPAVNNAIFPDTPSSLFWTATPYAGASGYAWYVDFDRGDGSFNNQESSFCARLVRGGE